MTISARRILSALATLSLAATALTLTPGRASADPACTQHVLNIVAHHDDDMFFLSPDLIGNLADTTVCVRTVFLVASDYHPDLANTEVDERLQYVVARETGIRQAYARASSLNAADWQASAYSAGGVAATGYALGDRLSIIETRIPDNASGGELWELYAHDTPLTTLQGDLNPPQQLDRASLSAFLRSVATDFQPDVINTVDPTADQHPEHSLPLYEGVMRFHPDHVTVARMVMWTFSDIPVRFYRDYTTLYEPANVMGATLATRLEVFEAYDAYDGDITLCDPDPDGNGENDTDANDDDIPDCGDGWNHGWLRRQYRADATWTGGLVVPLPPSTRPGPYLDHDYSLENMETGQRVAVAVPGEDEPVVSWPAFPSTNETFRLSATKKGWRMENHNGNLCLAVRSGSQQAGALIVQMPCDGSDAQAIRIQGDEAGGHLLRFARSSAADMVMTVTGGYGTEIVQSPADGGLDQRWRLVPASA